MRQCSNRLDSILSGKLGADEMRIALDEPENKSKDIKNGKMSIKLSKFNFRLLAPSVSNFPDCLPCLG